MKEKANLVIIFILLLAGAAVVSNFYVYAPDIGQVGGPISGLSLLQLKKFYECRDLFKKQFTVKEGLGPLYNADSCYSCHGFPGIPGSQGLNPAKDCLTYVASSINPSDQFTAQTIRYQDSNFHAHEGGPVIVSKSITKEFPNLFAKDCQMPPGSVPRSTFISKRLAPALWGLGLVDAIPEENLEDLELEQGEGLFLAGASVSHRDRITHQDRLGRFGDKGQYTSILDAIAEQMNTTLGITSKYEREIRTGKVNYNLPDCIRAYLPEEPNDNGAMLAKLSYFVALSSPPPPGKIDAATNQGRTTFEKLGCASCHLPTLNTGSEYYVLDPDSQFPTKRYLRIQALENREVNAYSDFLLHGMGPVLADGIATAGGVAGGQWRTTPLWGLRLRKYYLHDGRTTDLSEAVLAHGGQAQSARDNFASLSAKEKDNLLAFLKSL